MGETNTQPPAGSTIGIVEDFDGATYRWKAPHSGFIRYLGAFFFCVWLVGWAAGLVSVVGQLLKGPPNGDQLFMVVWLAFWTAGGAFACYMLYRLFGPCQPEVVILGRESFFYDSGVLTMDNRLIFHALQYGDAQAIMGRLHGKRTRIELDKQEVGPVTLERVGSRQRLRFDHGADRIEIGLFLREPEREWLAAEIQNWQQGS